MPIRAVISDFGGVLTTPLEASIAGYFLGSGIALEDLGAALAEAAGTAGANPLFELECGRITEAEFTDALQSALVRRLDRAVDLSDFGAELFAGLQTNHAFVEHLRGVRARGLRMAICTNNVREWASRWRALVPVEELFDLVVDSSELGVRKPAPEIYTETLTRLGVDASEAVFIDDLEVNCEAAEALGLRAVWFRDSAQAIADLEAALSEAR